MIAKRRIATPLAAAIIIALALASLTGDGGVANANAQGQAVTVTGLVYPIATDRYNIGDNILELHATAVELRATFLTPAPPNLCTTAVATGVVGQGQFTFGDVPFGSYILYIKRPGYVIRAMPVTIDGSGGPVVALASPGAGENGLFNLQWGDCNGDGRADNEDCLTILDLSRQDIYAVPFDIDPLYDPACDLNSDRRIDTLDLMRVFEAWDIDWMPMDYPGAELVDFLS
jgi:hypothetical protein